MKEIQDIKSDIPPGMTLPEYRKWIRPAKRHSPIRRFASFGLLR